MSYAEFTSNKKFKVVKIIEHEGISKEEHNSHKEICDKVVKVFNLFEDASVIIVPVDYLDGNELPENGSKAISTSHVESISLSNPAFSHVRLVIETTNAVYYLDEIIPEIKVPNKLPNKE